MAEGDVVQAPASVEVVVDPLEAVRLQAEEHPLMDGKAPETLMEKCLHLIHLKAYDRASTYAEGRDVLDVGCNTGYGTLHLVGAATSVTGVDVSADAIDVARTREGADAVDYRLIDGAGLPFDDASFDLVTSFQVIEHVADPMPYLDEIKRVLRPGGMALFTTPNAAIRLDPGMRPWNRFHVKEYRGAELAALLGDVFADVEVVGMFGVPTLYDLEVARVGKSRRHQRRQLAAEKGAAEAEARAEAGAAEPTPPATAPAPATRPEPSVARRVRRRLGKTSLGTAALRAAGRAPAPRAAAPAPVPPPPPPAPVAAAPEPEPVDFTVYTVDDLFYSARDLDRSIDLLAICHVAD